MSSNPDKIYQAKAALDPVAPATLWLYPQLKRVKGPMQRSTLSIAKRKASITWLFRILMLVWLAVLALRIWAYESGRTGLWRSTNEVGLVVLLALVVLLIFQFFRIRRFLSLELASHGTSRVDG